MFNVRVGYDNRPIRHIAVQCPNIQNFILMVGVQFDRALAVITAAAREMIVQNRKILHRPHLIPKIEVGCRLNGVEPRAEHGAILNGNVLGLNNEEAG